MSSSADASTSALRDVPPSPPVQPDALVAAFEAAGVGLCLLDPAGLVLHANEDWLRAAGFTREDALGRDIWALFPEAPPELRRLHEEARRGRTVHVPAHRQLTGGRTVWYEGELSPVPLPGGVGVLITAVDLTERRRGEDELRASEERYRMLHESLRDPFVQVTMDGRIVECNDLYSRMLGYAPAELYALTYRELTPERWHAVEERIVREQILPRGYSDVYEKEYRRKDGTVFPVELRTILSRTPAGEPDRMWAIVRDVTERKRAEEAIRTADARKSEFLAILSHELRNPLAPIRNSLAVLGRAPGGSPMAARALEVLNRQTEHLTRLVDDLLDLTRIERGKIELQRSTVDLREIVRRACADVRGLYELRGVELSTAEPAQPLWANADPARVAQMIGNLLANALKFTPAAGQVRVTLEARGTTCQVSVRDSGLGIAPEHLESIFDPFVQAARTPHGPAGLGIGLALVRELATRHGGAVRAASAGPGRGAEFVLELPSAPPPPAAPAPTRPRAAPARLSVLIVEDNEDAAASLADMMSLQGHEARVAATGRGGVEAVAARSPDVLFCDLGLPDMVGFDVIRAVRALPGGAAIHAVALTGYAQPRDQAQARAAGFDSHLGKPASLEELEAVLDEVARRKELGV